MEGEKERKGEREREKRKDESREKREEPVEPFCLDLCVLILLYVPDWIHLKIAYFESKSILTSVLWFVI